MAMILAYDTDDEDAAGVPPVAPIHATGPPRVLSAAKSPVAPAKIALPTASITGPPATLSRAWPTSPARTPSKATAPASRLPVRSPGVTTGEDDDVVLLSPPNATTAVSPSQGANTRVKVHVKLVGGRPSLPTPDKTRSQGTTPSKASATPSRQRLVKRAELAAQERPERPLRLLQAPEQRKRNESLEKLKLRRLGLSDDEADSDEERLPRRPVPVLPDAASLGASWEIPDGDPYEQELQPDAEHESDREFIVEDDDTSGDDDNSEDNGGNGEWRTTDPVRARSQQPALAPAPARSALKRRRTAQPAGHYDDDEELPSMEAALAGAGLPAAKARADAASAEPPQRRVRLRTKATRATTLPGRKRLRKVGWASPSSSSSSESESEPVLSDDNADAAGNSRARAAPSSDNEAPANGHSRADDDDFQRSPMAPRPRAAWGLLGRYSQPKSPARSSSTSNNTGLTPRKKRQLALPDGFSLDSADSFETAFTRYIQFLASAACDPDFIPSVLDDQDPYFMPALARIDADVTVRKESVASNAWEPEFRRAVEARPYIKTSPGHSDGSNCDACHRAHHLATVVLRLYGPTYDPQTFQTIESNDDPADDLTFLLGRHCAVRASMYHRLHHCRISLFESVAREARELQKLFGAERAVREIIENEAWIAQLQRDYKRQMDEAVALMQST